MADLGRKVFDLEENLREKDQVIAARSESLLTAGTVLYLNDLGRKVFDLEENLREKDQVIAARSGS